MSDLISRQAAIDACHDYEDGEGAYAYGFIVEERLRNLPSAQSDLSSYSDKLWRNAYERGRADAVEEIIHCRDCRWRNDQNGSTAWLPCRAIVTPSDFYCGRAERREE